MLERIAVRQSALAGLMPGLLLGAEGTADLLSTGKKRPHDLAVILNKTASIHEARDRGDLVGFLKSATPKIRRSRSLSPHGGTCRFQIRDSVKH